MTTQFETLDELNDFYRELLTDKVFSGTNLASVTTRTMNEKADVVTTTTVDPTTGQEIPTTEITPSDDAKSEEPRYIGQFSLNVNPTEVVKGETNEADPAVPKEDQPAESETDSSTEATPSTDPTTETTDPNVTTEIEEVPDN